MKIIRAILSFILLIWDRFFPASVVIQRNPERQKEVDAQTKTLALYQFNGCPFCIKVRRKIKSLALNIEYRDALEDEKFKAELIQNGGQYQVPCLKIQNERGPATWMYESDNINGYLESRFLN